MSLFELVVRHFRWLALIPGAPHFFDAALLLSTAVLHPRTLRAMEALEAAALAMPGISSCVHRLGGIGFLCSKREIAHLHGNGLVDVLLPRDEARERIQAGLAEPHHRFPDSAWVSVWMRDPGDVPCALAALTAAAENVKRSGIFHPLHQGPVTASSPL